MENVDGPAKYSSDGTDSTASGARFASVTVTVAASVLADDMTSASGKLSADSDATSCRVARNVKLSGYLNPARR
ncbi:hypothetical protein AWU67_08430 [Microterricola viridarii]|uniref:Uncharacterized protein n=1 Tax=Microterricola viridarii TaxID=412690 RepID=A0A109QYR2_9MICO|nr:hypothetical protein AWU67_08430 [Microterricola viridarii]